MVPDGPARLAALLAAGQRLADPADPLGQEARARLSTSTGLSRENVSLCLERHLEAAAADSLLHALGPLHRATHVHVVLSANVFVGALRALVLAALVAEHVTALPSRREPVFVELLLRGVGEIAGSEAFFSVASSLEAAKGDHVHVYGRDESIAAIARSLPGGTWLWPHGTGAGIVVARDGNAIDPESVADDVVPFDQRGCLSPRVVLVGAGGRELSRALAESLARRLRAVPLGETHPADRHAAAAYRQTMSAVGEAFGGLGALVGYDPAPRDLLFPAPARTVHVVETRDPWPLIAPFSARITCVAGDDDETAARLPAARRSAVGQMQRPILDGPVDLRTPNPVPIESARGMTK